MDRTLLSNKIVLSRSSELPDFSLLDFFYPTRSPDYRTIVS